MAAVRKNFSLCEAVAGALHTVSEAYGMDGCWLPWQFEKHILTSGATPFRISTNEYPRALKNGVDKVTFHVHYDNNNPNLLKVIEFDEVPSKCKYIVTQTSMKHVKDDVGNNCTLWIEMPKHADREGIAGAKSLFKAEICCEEWKDHLPQSPETALERAQLCLAQNDLGWLKGQVTFKDVANARLSSALASSNGKITTLNAEIGKIKAEAKDAAVHDLKAELKLLNKKMDKLCTTLKDKNGNTTKPLQDLDANGSTVEDSGSEPLATVTKKRKRTTALKTPNGKLPASVKVPSTAPGKFGTSSTLGSATPSQNSTLTSVGTTARTPLPSAARPQNAAFTLRDTAIRGRTRATTMAVFAVDHTPPANTASKSPSLSSLTSCIESDGDVFIN